MLRTAAVLSLFLAFASAALAGGNRPSNSSWISLSASGAAAPSAVSSSTVTLYEGTSATVQPFVHLRCYQNGNLVLEGWQAVFTSPSGSAMFSLSSAAWQGGTATCNASLENW